MLAWVSLVSTFEIGFLGSDWAASKDREFWFLFVANRVVDVFFIVDLLFSSVTGYYDENVGIWVNDNWGIAVHYLRSWFFIDFISCIPFDMINMLSEANADAGAAQGSVSNLKVMRLLRLLRIAKLLRLLRASRIIKRLSSKLIVSYRAQVYISGFLKVALLGHWGACAFHLLAMMQEEDQRHSWLHMPPLDLHGPDGKTLLGRLQQNKLDGNGIASQYITSLHWCIAALKAEDTFSTTPLERCLGLLIMIVGAALWANLASAVVITELSLNSSDIDYKRSMDNLLVFCRVHHIPAHVVQLLREYLMRCKSMHSTNHRREVLMQLSPSLRGLVALHCNTGWIMKVPYLRPHSTEAANYLTDMSLHLQNTAFPAGENVVKFDEPNSRMFVIKYGVVCSSRGHICTNGSYFGEDMVTSLVSPLMSRTYSTMALSFCEAYFLTSGDLNQILNGIRYPKTRRLCRISAFRLHFRMQFTLWISETKKQMELQGRRNRVAPGDGTKIKLFLSYGRGKATEFTKWAKQELTDRGFEVWMDDQIESGEDWEKAIGDAILNCDGIVCVIDRKYKISTFCKDEISLAKSEGKAIFPILFRDFDFADLPAYLKFILASVNVVKFETKSQDGERIEALCRSMTGQFSHKGKAVSTTDPVLRKSMSVADQGLKAVAVGSHSSNSHSSNSPIDSAAVNKEPGAGPEVKLPENVLGTEVSPQDVQAVESGLEDAPAVERKQSEPSEHTAKGATPPRVLAPLKDLKGKSQSKSLKKGRKMSMTCSHIDVSTGTNQLRRNTLMSKDSLLNIPHSNFPDNAAFWRSAANANVKKAGKASRYADSESLFKQQLAMAAPRHVQLPSGATGGMGGAGMGDLDCGKQSAELAALHQDLDGRLATIERQTKERSVEMSERIETLESALTDTQRDIEAKLEDSKHQLMCRLDQIVGLLAASQLKQ
jgi:potassium voltage-gated channel Eag-related subfamily H protein 7